MLVLHKKNGVIHFNVSLCCAICDALFNKRSLWQFYFFLSLAIENIQFVFVYGVRRTQSSEKKHDFTKKNKKKNTGLFIKKYPFTYNIASG